MVTGDAKSGNSGAMPAAWYSRLGGPEVLHVGEQPIPEPEQAEVRVRLSTSGVNPSDWKARQRGRGSGIPFPLIIPHSDGAGVIDAVGPGVDEDRVGQRVWVSNAQWQRPFGTAARYACQGSEYVVDLPDDVGFDEGACFGIPFLTAHHAVLANGPVDGATILVVGGAGAVGDHAIQIAKVNGARVLTTVSTPAKADHARGAGADATIDYRSEDVAARVLELTDGVGADRIVETNLSANAPMYDSLLAPGGTSMVVGTEEPTAQVPAHALIRRGVTLRWFIVYELTAAERAAGIAELDRLLTSGQLRTTIAARLPLGQIREAHEMVERAAHIGNVVIDIP